MNSNDEVAKELMNLVLDVSKYAHENNLDITSKIDVRKILIIIRPDETDSVNLDTLIEGLVAFDKMAKDEAAKRQKLESN